MAAMSDLNSSLVALRATRIPDTAFAPGTLAPGLTLHSDPAAGITGQWRSPRGRLLELETTVTTPGGWLALHLVFPLRDLAGVVWLGFALRGASDRGVALRACLRSGVPGGFHDSFFDRHILAQPMETDHHDLIAPDRVPGLPLQAPWREFILFLPPDRDLRLSLHDLRIFAL
jgi:hypothetical protein